MIRGAIKSFSMTVIFGHYCWTIFGFLNNQHVEANHCLIDQSPACIRPDLTFCHPPWKTIVNKKSPVRSGFSLGRRTAGNWKKYTTGVQKQIPNLESLILGGFCRWVFGTVSFPGNSLRKWRFWDVELTWSFDSQVVKVTLLTFGDKNLGHFAWITWVPKKHP